MKKKTSKQPGLPILAHYAMGKRESLPNWSGIIEGDAELRRRAAVLGRLYNMLQAVDFSRTLPAAARLAGDIFDHYRSGRNISGGEAARLYYDSRRVPLPEGIRLSLTSERRLKYHSDRGDVELSIMPVYPGRYEVTGRCEWPGTSCPVTVRLRGRRVMTAEVDEFGFFSFAAVNPDRYRMRIGTGDHAIIISDLTLR